MVQVALAGVGPPELLTLGTDGHSIAYMGGVAVEPLASELTFTPTTAASSEVAATLVLAHAPLASWIPMPGLDGPIVWRGADDQAVALPGLVARGVDNTVQTFVPTPAGPAAFAGNVTFSLAAERAWTLPVMGLEPMLLRGEGANWWPAPGIVMAFDEPSSQTWLPVTASSTAVANDVTFTLGRWSFVLATSGFPSDPIAMMPP